MLRTAGQSSSPCAIEWQKAFGGRQDDYLQIFQQDRGGGFILAGNPSSGVDSAKMVASYGGADCWVSWLDSLGEMSDQQAFGGTGYDAPSSIVDSSDGGVVIGGLSDQGTNGSETSLNYGGLDYSAAF